MPEYRRPDFMGFQGKPQIPDPRPPARTPAYKAHLYACPPGISLLCPVASHLWAHTGPKSFPSPFMSLSVISRAPWLQELILGGPAL